MESFLHYDQLSEGILSEGFIPLIQNEMLYLCWFIWYRDRIAQDKIPQDKIPQDKIPQYEKWTKFHNYERWKKFQQLYEVLRVTKVLSGNVYTTVHHTQHMRSIVSFEDF